MYSLKYSLAENPHRWAFALAALALAGVLVFVILADVRPAVQNWGAAPGEIGELRAAVLTVPGQLAGQILPVAQLEIRHATDTLVAEVRGAREQLGGQVEAARLEILGPEGRFVRLQDAVLGRVDEGLRIVDVRTRDALGQVAGLRGDLQPTLAHAASITAHADGAAAILFRRDALPAQLLGLTAAAKVTLGETAQTMRTVRDAAPLFVAQGQKITADFGGITANINRLTKPHWYDRLLGYGLNGAILFRELHPATSLTIKGAEWISSQR